MADGVVSYLRTTLFVSEPLRACVFERDENRSTIFLYLQSINLHEHGWNVDFRSITAATMLFNTDLIYLVYIKPITQSLTFRATWLTIRT